MESDSEYTKQEQEHLSSPRRPLNRKSLNRLRTNFHRLPTIILRPISTCRGLVHEEEEAPEEEEGEEEVHQLDQIEGDLLVNYYEFI